MNRSEWAVLWRVGIFGVVLGMGTCWSVARAADARQVLNAEEQTQRASKLSQERVDTLADNAQQALAEYRKTLYRISQLKLYSKELDAQLDSQQQAVKRVQQQMDALGSTQEEVVPLMLRMVDTLGMFVEADAPILRKERRDRVKKLRAALHDSSLGVGEQFRRILQAYQVEANYGKELDTWRGELKFGQQIRAVDFIKLGRVAVYYLSLDGDKGGMWLPGKRVWQPLGSTARGQLRQALKLAKHDIAPELLRLPVPPPVDETDAGSKS